MTIHTRKPFKLQRNQSFRRLKNEMWNSHLNQGVLQTGAIRTWRLSDRPTRPKTDNVLNSTQGYTEGAVFSYSFYWTIIQLYFNFAIHLYVLQFSYSLPVIVISNVQDFTLARLMEDIFGAAFSHVVLRWVGRIPALWTVNLALPLVVNFILKLKPPTLRLRTVHHDVQQPVMGSIPTN